MYDLKTSVTIYALFTRTSPICTSNQPDIFTRIRSFDGVGRSALRADATSSHAPSVADSTGHSAFILVTKKNTHTHTQNIVISLASTQ